MAITIRGENVYECDVCNRKTRVQENKHGLDILSNCNITLGCLGKLHRVFNRSDINDTPATPLEVPGVTDWVQRRVLYDHIQLISESVWTINHNLSNIPALHIYTTLHKENGSVEYVTVDERDVTVAVINANTMSITFPRSVSGMVQCISLSSQNTTNPNAIAPTVATATQMQLSGLNCEISIATLNTAPLVGITLGFNTPTGVTNIDYTGVDNVPSINSPWVNARTAIFNGKKYSVRSFNLMQTSPAPLYFSTGMIPNGSSFRVVAVNGAPYKHQDVLFLLGRSPYTAVDRIVDRYIDASSVDQIAPQMFYDSGNAYVSSEVIQATYPQILVV